MRFIPHPAVDSDPVSLWRWLKWHVGVWMVCCGIRWQNQAMDRCESCGQFRHGRDHTECDHIPF